MSTPTITPKQERFCQEYVVDLNATQAAIRAGYSAKTARTTACQYLAKRNIAGRIAELAEKRLKAVEASAKDVIAYLSETMFDTTLPRRERTVAAIQLAKYHNLLIDRKEVKHTGRVEHWHTLEDIRMYKSS